MILTLTQYLANPQGKGSVLAHVRQWKAEYDPRYLKVLEGAHGAFETNVYKNGGNQYFIHVKMPSETHADIMYDVVLKVDKKGLVSTKSIDDWHLRAISNSPSFVYTYENVFKRNKLLVEELKSLLPDETYSDPPKIRNPFNAVGFEKTVYYAIRYISDKYSTISQLDEISSKLNLKTLRSEFTVFDKVMSDIDREQAKKVEANKKIRAEQKKQKKQRNVIQPDSILSNSKQKMITAAKIVGRSNNRVKPKNSLGTISHRAKSVKKV